jgi:TRAP-type uncharacterized transport system fused permease subunit
MAGADMWKTSVIAVKLGLATFIVPFMFWLSPALLAQGELPAILQAFVSASLGVWLLACSTEGWMLNGRLPVPLRLLAAVAGVLLMVPEAWTDLTGLALGIGLLLWQRRAFPTERAA